MHENLPTVGDALEEERLLTQSIEYLTKATGKRPVGFPRSVVGVQSVHAGPDSQGGIFVRQQLHGHG
jgi:hypothetical protein